MTTTKAVKIEIQHITADLKHKSGCLYWEKRFSLVLPYIPVASNDTEATDPTYPGSDDTGPTYPGSDDTGPTYPGSDDTGPTYPWSDDTGPTYPGSDDTGPTYPGSDDTGPTYPGSDDTGPTYPGSDDTGPTYPGSDDTEVLDEMRLHHLRQQLFMVRCTDVVRGSYSLTSCTTSHLQAEPHRF